jgi:hypothetical protein
MSAMKKRTRSRGYGKSWSKRYTRSSKTKPWTLVVEADLTLVGTQVTESEGHQFRKHYEGDDLGGDFLTAKTEAAGYAGPVVEYETPDGLEKIVGLLRHPNAPSGVAELGKQKAIPQEQDFAKAKSDLSEKGATAVSLCSPTNPLTKLAVTLAETFREGLPHLPGVPTWRGRAKDHLARDIAGEHLNVTFGWLPLLNEIKEVADLASHFATTVEQYKRDEGRLVRREFHFDVEHSETTKLVTTNSPIRIGPTSLFFGQGGGSTPRVDTYVTEFQTRRCWFSGAFRYHIPDSLIGNIIETASRSSDFVSNFIGNSLTPQLLWELTPWSWAVDYFSNAQQVIDNLSNMELYGLFMAYGYVMDENIRGVTYSSKPAAGSASGPTCPSYGYVEVSKKREKANPYGFGVSWDDLTPLQVANLIAAGFTRLL